MVAGLVMAACLTACSDDTADRKDAEEVERQALDAVDGVVHDVAEATGLEFVSGRHGFVVCGEGQFPGGVIHRVTLNFGPSDEPAEDVVAAAATALETDDWTVERVSNPRIVSGVKDKSTLRFEFGPAASNVQVRSDCVDTSNDVANAYQDEGSTDLTWK